jgi:hypothetical protein
MNLFKRILPFIILALLTQACDKVEPPYKKDIVVPVGERKVLVEDFTGHKCGNCPRATRAIYDLKSVYGDKLIIMAIHAGTFATVFPPGAPYYTYDFRCPEGVQIDTDFGISVAGNPNGMVNRRTVNGSQIISSTKWGDEVAAVLNSTEKVPVKISIASSYNNTSRQLDAGVTLEYFSALTGNYKLCVFMVEDSVINWQKDYDVSPNDVPDYVHREFLRGSMNGTYGTSVSETSQGSIKTYNFTSVLNSEWNDTQMSLIVFLYNDATKEILQVEQKHIE